jgi:hypothetical protein
MDAYQAWAQTKIAEAGELGVGQVQTSRVYSEVIAAL